MFGFSYGVVRSYGYYDFAFDGDRLLNGELPVYGDDFAVVQDEIGVGGEQWRGDCDQAEERTKHRLVIHRVGDGGLVGALGKCRVNSRYTKIHAGSML